MVAELLIILFLILLNGFFALSEMALVSSRKARLRHEAEQGRKKYADALDAAENPSHFLSTIQVVITLIGTLAGAFGGATIAHSLQAGLQDLALPAAIAAPVSVAVVVILTAFVSVILGELVPKNIALAHPEPIAASVIGTVRRLSKIVAPISRFLSWITDLIIALLGISESSEPEVTEDEVRVLIAQGTATGVFEKREQEMVEGVLSLGDRRITALMTPRTEILFVNLREGREEARRLILRNAQFASIPAIDGDVDSVVGILTVKDCLAAIANDQFADPRSFLKKALFVPESVSALKAFSLMKAAGTKSALIIDEYGGIAGLITITSLLESIVGDLPDEGLPEAPEIIRRQDGSYLVDGTLNLEAFSEELGLGDLASADYDTVAGLVLEKMGKIPRAGEHCFVGGCRIEVVDMDGNRIDKLLVSQEESGQGKAGVFTAD